MGTIHNAEAEIVGTKGIVFKRKGNSSIAKLILALDNISVSQVSV